MNAAREEILGKLSIPGFIEPSDQDFDIQVFHSLELPLEEEFKKNIELIGGKVYIAGSETDFAEYLKDLLLPFRQDEICCNETDLTDLLSKNSVSYSNYTVLPETLKVGITGCEYLIAHTGSVMVSSAQKGGRQLFVYPSIHVVIAKKNQLIDYLAYAYALICKKYKDNLPSHIALITGASRTADIEKTLVMGAHGPKELHVLII